METVLKELTNLGSSGVSRAIEGYARWYLVSAIGWLTVGIVFVVGGYKLSKIKSNDIDGWNEWIRYVVMGLAVFIGIVMIIHNLSTICAVEAYAIHHFIKDIKP